MTTTETSHPAGAIETIVSRLSRVGACYGAEISPDGESVAFLSNLSGVFQVWAVPISGGWPVLITPFDDWIVRVQWSPDGSMLAFGMAPGGGMNQQIYTIRRDGTDARLITAGGQDNNWLQRWMPDGRGILIVSNQDDPDAMHVYRADLDSGEVQLLVRNQGTGSIEDVDREGKRLILQRVAHRSDANLFLIEIESGAEHLLTPHEGPGNFPTGRFSPDGQTVYLASDENRDRIAFARVHVGSGGVPEPIEVLAARDDADLEFLEISPDGSEAVLVWNVAGRNELAFHDCAAGETTPGPALPAECVRDITYAPDGRALVMTLIGAASASNVWMLDRATGTFTPITRSPHPGVDLDGLVGPELVRFPAHDGLELSGWLYRPHDFSAPGAVVLDFHGGPEGQARPAFNATYAALLAGGIAVLAPNVRGSSGFGKRFVNLDNGPLRFDAIRDIKACVDYVTGAGIADPGRIGISGGSYGGYMTMAGLTEYPELLAAGANLFGVVNFETFFAHTEPWMAAISKIEYGDPDTESELLRALSPIHRIDRVQAPTLVLHGANDTNVPVVEAEQVVQSLRERHVPVEYILFPDEGHGWGKTANRIHAATAVVGWFSRYLRSSEA